MLRDQQHGEKKQKLTDTVQTPQLVMFVFLNVTVQEKAGGYFPEGQDLFDMFGCFGDKH